MELIDVVIGLTLMNAMPHFVIRTWRGRLLSLFGTGPRANLAYSLLNVSASLGLFVATYGVSGLAHNGLYVGALLILLIYYVTGDFFYRRYNT